MTHDLSDQVAVVTGGSRGIGAATAKRLGAAGATVVVVYRSGADAANTVVDEIQQAGGKAEAFQADVSSEEAVAKLFQHVTATHERIDVLVNAAGAVKDTLLLSMKPKDWHQVLDTNLGGTFLCMRQALNVMMRARRGRVINLASIQALRGARGQANYAAAKAGVIALTRAAALEVAGVGVRVNAVLPGLIETDMTARIRRQAGEEALSRIPLGRFGTPDDVTGMILFLCSDDADYVTGQTFVVDGGLSIQ